MQPGIKFRLKRIIDETVPCYSSQPFERCAHHRDRVMRFSSWTRPGMTGVAVRIIDDIDLRRSKAFG